MILARDIVIGLVAAVAIYLAAAKLGWVFW
jgi:hypothetical protein